MSTWVETLHAAFHAPGRVQDGAAVDEAYRALARAESDRLHRECTPDDHVRLLSDLTYHQLEFVDKGQVDVRQLEDGYVDPSLPSEPFFDPVQHAVLLRTATPLEHVASSAFGPDAVLYTPRRNLALLLWRTSRGSSRSFT